MSFGPAQSWQLIVVQDYGQFYLCSAATDASERTNTSAAVEKAIDADASPRPGH